MKSVFYSVILSITWLWLCETDTKPFQFPTTMYVTRYTLFAMKQIWRFLFMVLPSQVGNKIVQHVILSYTFTGKSNSTIIIKQKNYSLKIIIEDKQVATNAMWRVSPLRSDGGLYSQVRRAVHTAMLVNFLEVSVSASHVSAVSRQKRLLVRPDVTQPGKYAELQVAGSCY